MPVGTSANYHDGRCNLKLITSPPKILQSITGRFVGLSRRLLLNQHKTDYDITSGFKCDDKPTNLSLCIL